MAAPGASPRARTPGLTLPHSSLATPCTHIPLQGRLGWCSPPFPDSGHSFRYPAGQSLGKGAAEGLVWLPCPWPRSLSGTQATGLCSSSSKLRQDPTGLRACGA